MAVPSDIKCLRCEKVKDRQAFAKKRLEDLNNKIAKEGNNFNAAKQAYIACTPCTGGQVVELFCEGCDRWKGKASFSKAQAKTPDDARCIICMEDRRNIEPGASSDSKSDSGAESDSDGSQVGTKLGGTIAGVSGMSLTNGAASSGGGVALMSPAPSETSTVLPPHLRKGTPSVTSGNSKFAKLQRAPTRKVYSDAAQNERDREVKLDEDIEVATSESDGSD